MSSKVSVALTQFNNGLVSPELEGRTDLQMAPYSCRQLENMVATVFGGVKGAGGSKYAATALGETVLVGFAFSRTVAYMLEFTDYKMRVYKNHSLVTNEDGSVYEALTPYSIDQMRGSDTTPRVDVLQISDVMYMAHENVPLQKLCHYADNDWRFEAVVLAGGPFKNVNTDKKKVMTTDGTSGYLTLAANGGGNIEIMTPLYFTSGGLTENNQSYSSDMDGARVQAIFDGKTIMDYSYPGGIWNQNNYSEYFVRGFQMANIGILCEVTSNNYMSFRLTDTSLGLIYSGKTLKLRAYRHRKGGHNDGWRERDFTFGEASQWNAFTEEDKGRLIRLTRVSENEQYWYAGRGGISVGTVLKSDGKFYEAQGQGTCGSVKPTHTEGTASDGLITWKYLHAGYGWGTITQYLDPQHVQIYVNETMPTLLSGTYKWEMGVLGEKGIYPRTVGYFKDRLLLGVMSATGPMFCFSATGDYENFADMEFGEVLSDSAFNLPVLTDQNELAWICPQEYLYAGTRGSVLEIKPMTSTDVFGPQNVTYDVISAAGGEPITPIALGASVIYLGAKGKAVYDLAYQANTDSYEPEEISLLAAAHLAAGVKEWALQYEPDRVIWAVTNDGTLMGLTYNKSQQVRAFHKHTTQGKYISVASIPGENGTTDELWTVVKRSLNGQDVYTVEYFCEGLPAAPVELSAREKRIYQRKYAYYVHCGRTFTFETPTKEISGLTWLEGCEVSVLADGRVEREKIVQNGAITLDQSASVVSVGLTYKRTFEPLPMTLDTNGTGNGKSYRIHQVILRLLNSGTFVYGPDENHLDIATLYAGGDLSSGELCLAWQGNNTHPGLNGAEIPNITGARMLFEQTTPLPLHILGVYPQVEVSND